MGRPIDMDWKECELSIDDLDIDLCVTMVRWVDVPDNDRGDFGRQRVVDISTLSFLSFFHGYNSDMVSIQLS